jgi:hypothetical protein
MSSNVQGIERHQSLTPAERNVGFPTYHSAKPRATRSRIERTEHSAPGMDRCDCRELMQVLQGALQA